MSKSTHGGAGRGQGRKHVGGTEATIRVTVRLSQSQYDWLARQGNVSEAIRKLIQEIINHEQNDQHE